MRMFVCVIYRKSGHLVSISEMKPQAKLIFVREKLICNNLLNKLYVYRLYWVLLDKREFLFNKRDFCS